jgi:hypothetical protein
MSSPEAAGPESRQARFTDVALFQNGASKSARLKRQNGRPPRGCGVDPGGEAHARDPGVVCRV